MFRAFALSCTLLSTLYIVAVTSQPMGGINFLTGSGSDYHYHINTTNGNVERYSKIATNHITGSGLHDSWQTLVIDEYDPIVKRTLILTGNKVEVYHDDLSSFRSVWVVSLSLQSGCEPWYLEPSKIPDSGEFYVGYHGNCRPSYFVYDDGFSSRHKGRRPANIIVETKDEDNVEIYLSDVGHRLHFEPIRGDFLSIATASQIGNCEMIHSLQPLHPLDSFRLYFTVNCTTGSNSLKHYHVVYSYQQFSPQVTVTDIELGVAVDDLNGEYLAVRGTDASLTLYETRNLENGIPGQRTFSSLKQIQFIQSGNLTWLSVSMENSNAHVVNVDVFISTRGRDGVLELSNTNIGECSPSCLPQLNVQGFLVVSTFDQATNTYGCVQFDLTSSTPRKTLNVTNIRAKPFAMMFVEDPNPPASVETITTSPPSEETTSDGGTASPTTSDESTTQPTPKSEPTPMGPTTPIVVPLADISDILRKVVPSIVVPFVALCAIVVIVIVIVLAVKHRNKHRQKFSTTVVKSHGPNQNKNKVGKPPNLNLSSLAQVKCDPNSPTTPLLSPQPANSLCKPVPESRRPIQEENQTGLSSEETKEGSGGPYDNVLPKKN